MAMVHEAPKEPSWLARALTTDFCPWANRFVYWLKEPVGWFVLATIVCVLIGMYFSPIGWTLAAALVSVIVVGMVWPWIAVRAVRCTLTPEVAQIHEGAPCQLDLSVRNRLPFPVMGLAVEGFLDRRSDECEEQPVPTAALAFVRGLSTSTFRFAIRPQLRGRYPDGEASLTSSFPFGIWTARRTLKDIAPITVWPKVFPIAGQHSVTGRRPSEQGNGDRGGRNDDFIGVREYRRGDCVKHINWLVTARAGSLIVNERSGPECPDLSVHVDVSPGRSRDELTDRIRVAASVLTNLHRASIPLRVCIGEQRVKPRRGREGFVQIMEALTDVPVDGIDRSSSDSQFRPPALITVSSDDEGNPTLLMVDPTASQRLANTLRHRVIDRGLSLDRQLLTLWTEARDVTLVA